MSLNWWNVLPVGLANQGTLQRTQGALDQAERDRQTALEEARRLRYQHQQDLSLARARGAASGIEFESASTQVYLNEMAAEYAREEDWLRQSAEAEAEAAREAAIWEGVGGIGSNIFGALRAT